jgi:hypothetical protein
MVNLYAVEEHMRQRTEMLRRELEEARQSVELRRSRAAAAAQMVRPESAQYGSRIWRFRSLPAWSRGRSATKSTDRGRL